MKKSEYYKIVSKTSRGRMSMMMTQLPDFLRVHYKIHRWVQAPLGGLLVFTNYQTAKNYFDRDPSTARTEELWRVLVKEPCILPDFRLGFAWSIQYRNNVKDLWKYKPIGDWLWPANTAAFKYVRLEERIK